MLFSIRMTVRVAVPMILLLAMLSASTAVSAGASAADGLRSGDSAACLRCHQMSTMARRNHDTGKVVDLSIHPTLYAQSAHRALVCGDCHNPGYQRYPHRSSLADEGLSCVGCHREQAKANHKVSTMDAIETEYQHSIHAPLESDGFSCFSCHDAHDFRPESKAAPPAQRVAADNAPCLDCHPEQRGDSPAGHDWLPRPSLHWQAVRCVDCHTPVNGPERVSHQVLSAADSARNCLQCHTRDSKLLGQLYTWRSDRALEEHGFFRQALYNDAYIVGMSRNDTLDRISLGVLALVLLGIVAHATGRWVAYRKRSRP